MSRVVASPRSSSALPDAISSWSADQTILALDPGTTAGYTLRTADGGTTSRTAEFRLDRRQSGGMRFLRFKH
jgi:hypothetical protein